MQAVSAGRDSTEQIFDVFDKKGGKPGDFIIALVFSKPDRLGKKVDPIEVFNPRDPHATSHDLAAVGRHLTDIPVGFIVCWLNREREQFIAHVRPLLLDKKTEKLLASLVDQAATLTDWRLS